MFTLKIGRRLTATVASIEDAQRAYRQARDESCEGASTFPEGRLTGDGRKLRISYNGRVWDGETCVSN